MSCTRFSHAFQLRWKWALEPLCLISNRIKNNGNHSLIDLYKPVIMTAVKGSLSRFFNAYLCAVLLSRVSSFPENLVNVTWTICCSISNRPLYCLCPWGNMPRKIYFSTAVEVLSRAHPRHPAPLRRCCLMVDLSKPLVVFTEGLMVSAKPAKPWRERSLQANEEQLVSPCLWQLECVCVRVR